MRLFSRELTMLLHLFELVELAQQLRELKLHT